MTATSSYAVEVKSDYDGYFESMVRGWIERKLERGEALKHSKFIVSAGPWRPYAVAFESNTDEGWIALDFYSAIRTGFGQLTGDDVRDIIALL